MESCTPAAVRARLLEGQLPRQLERLCIAGSQTSRPTQISSKPAAPSNKESSILHLLNSKLANNQNGKTKQSTQKNAQSDNAVTNAHFRSLLGREPAYEQTGVRQKYVDKLITTQSKLRSPFGHPPATKELSNSTTSSLDASDGIIDAIASQYSIALPTPPPINADDAASNAHPTTSRLAGNRPIQNTVQARPNTSQWSPLPASDSSTISDYRASHSYPTDTDVASLGNHNRRPPEPAVDRNLRELLAETQSPPLTDIKPKIRHKFKLRQRFQRRLSSIVNQLGGHRSRTPRGDRSTNPRGRQTRRGRGNAKGSADTAKLGASSDPTPNAWPPKRSSPDDEDDEDGSGGDERRNKWSKPNNIPPELYLACPFFKYDPIRYWRCFTVRARTAAHIRQHLKRKHFNPIACPNCFLIFESHAECNEHITAAMSGAVTCVRDAGQAPIEGLTEDQQKEITDCGGRREISEHDRWYDMWDIAFPGDRRRLSPLFGNPVAVLAAALLNRVAPGQTGAAVASTIMVEAARAVPGVELSVPDVRDAASGGDVSGPGTGAEHDVPPSAVSADAGSFDAGHHDSPGLDDIDLVDDPSGSNDFDTMFREWLSRADSLPGPPPPNPFDDDAGGRPHRD